MHAYIMSHVTNSLQEQQEYRRIWRTVNLNAARTLFSFLLCLSLNVSFTLSYWQASSMRQGIWPLIFPEPHSSVSTARGTLVLSLKIPGKDVTGVEPLIK